MPGAQIKLTRSHTVDLAQIALDALSWALVRHRLEATVNWVSFDGLSTGSLSLQKVAIAC